MLLVELGFGSISRHWQVAWGYVWKTGLADSGVQGGG